MRGGEWGLRQLIISRVAVRISTAPINPWVGPCLWVYMAFNVILKEEKLKVEMINMTFTIGLIYCIIPVWCIIIEHLTRDQITETTHFLFCYLYVHRDIVFTRTREMYPEWTHHFHFTCWSVWIPCVFSIWGKDWYWRTGRQRAVGGPAWPFPSVPSFQCKWWQQDQERIWENFLEKYITLSVPAKQIWLVQECSLLQLSAPSHLLTCNTLPELT